MSSLKGIVRDIILAKKNHIPDGPTYWTCFYYEGYTPNELHCTHKFFGNWKSPGEY